LLPAACGAGRGRLSSIPREWFPFLFPFRVRAGV